MIEHNSEKIVRNKITLLSFICSFFVIFAHTRNVETYGIDANSMGLAHIVWGLETFLSEIMPIAIPTFFFLSGFLFFRTFELEKMLEKYKSRIKSILVPYLIWCTIYYLYFVILTNAPIISNYMSSEPYVFSVKNWIMALWIDSYYTLWFLKNLICFIAVTPIIFVLIKNWKYVPAGTVVLSLLFLNSVFHFITFPEGIEVYSLGSYLAINHKDIVYYKNRYLSLLGTIAAALLFCTKYLVLNPITMAAFILCVWFALDYVNLDCEFPWWMRITFFTYVFHDIVLEMLEKAFLLVGGKSPLLALIDYLFMPFVTFGVIVLIAWILRHNKMLWRILCGDR